MDKKMRKMFWLVFIFLNLMFTELSFSQLLTVLDSTIRIRPEHTFIIGEIHPCQVESRGLEESISQNLITNYFDYKLNVTEVMIRNRELQQVILEFPVYMEYNLMRYLQTKDTNWLYDFECGSFAKKMMIEYLDLLDKNHVKIRCIDLPTKGHLPFLKLSLLNILLKHNNLKAFIDFDRYLKVDSLHNLSDCYNIERPPTKRLRSLKAEKFMLFQQEIHLLILKTHTKSKRKNRKIHKELQVMLQKHMNEYRLLLGEDFGIYTRILHSLESYLAESSSRCCISQNRERFLASQFLIVSQPYQLVITGRVHVHQIVRYIYKKHYNYKNFYELLIEEAIPVLPNVIYFPDEFYYRSNHEDEWIKDMELIERIKTSIYQIDIYQDAHGRLRIVTQIYYSKNLNDQLDQ